MKDLRGWIEKKIEILKQSKNVEKLDFSGAGLNDKDIDFICDKLADSSVFIEKLDLSRNIITKESTKSLILLKKVGTLDVSNNYLTEEDIEMLKKISISKI